MKLILAGLLILVVGTQAKWFPQFPRQAFRGHTGTYRDMGYANYKNFHARGNYDAAQRGAGGRWAARIISDARENIQGNSGRGHLDSAADQEANRWGHNGGDPNRYRPEGLPNKY